MENRDVLIAFYRQALTVNSETNSTELLNAILTDDFVSFGSADSKTKIQLIGQVAFFWKLVPDLKWEPQELINEGYKFVVRSVATGTPVGDFMGIPTDGTRSFNIMTIDIHKLVDGKIASVHHLEDWSTALKQLS